MRSIFKVLILFVALVLTSQMRADDSSLSAGENSFVNFLAEKTVAIFSEVPLERASRFWEEEFLSADGIKSGKNPFDVLPEQVDRSLEVYFTDKNILSRPNSEYILGAELGGVASNREPGRISSDTYERRLRQIRDFRENQYKYREAFSFYREVMDSIHVANNINLSATNIDSLLKSIDALRAKGQKHRPVLEIPIGSEETSKRQQLAELERKLDEQIKIAMSKVTAFNTTYGPTVGRVLYTPQGYGRLVSLQFKYGEWWLGGIPVTFLALDTWEEKTNHALFRWHLW